MDVRLTSHSLLLIIVSLTMCGPAKTAVPPALSLDVSYRTEPNTNSRFLVINCSLDSSRTNLETVATLALLESRPYGGNEEFDQLAVVDIWSRSPKLSGELEQANVSIVGEIGPESSKHSSLVLSWNDPTTRYPHTYKCVANGLDKDGQAASLSTIVKIEVLGGGSCQNSLRLELELQRISTATETSANTSAEISQQVQSLDKKVDELEAKIEAFHLSTRLHSTLLAIDKSRFDVDLSGVTRDRVYLASKQVAVFNIAEANRACQASGGYLVELDDDEEKQTVIDFAKGIGETDHFALGGTDMAKEGHFVYFNSGKPVPQKVTWIKGQPNNHGGNEGCMEIYLPGAGLNDIPCKTAVKYLCEVPLSYF